MLIFENQYLVTVFFYYRLANHDSYSEYDISRCIQQITAAIQVRYLTITLKYRKLQGKPLMGIHFDA